MRAPLMPSVTIPGDRKDSIIARSGNLLGLSRTYAIWNFGFLEHSDAARAYGVYNDHFLFVKSKHNGKIVKRYEGFAYSMPVDFKRVLEAKVW